MNTESSNTAADYIQTHDPKLADMFRNQPFQRVNIAKAFAAGLSTPAGQHDYQMGQTIIDLAEMDRQERLEMATN